MMLINVSTRKFPNTFAKVSNEDFNWLNQWKWRAFKGTTGPVYVVRHEDFMIEDKKEREFFWMHRFITGASPDLLVDHRDGDGLNNQRDNLRTCTHQENQRNHPARGGKYSKFKGVSAARGRFFARIGCNGKSKHLGSFLDDVSAAKCYDEAAKELFGEFARLNFPQAEVVAT